MDSSDTTFFMHHYEPSPYAEKIRAMFGHTGDRWASVLSPPYPPRPNVDPLAGGYRRIPIAQIGADVFCDTTIISTEVAALTGHDELLPKVGDSDAGALVARAEGAVFFAAITSVPPLKLLGKLLMTNGPVGTIRFVRDRTGMMKGSTIKPPQGKAAAEFFDAFLSDLNDHLAGRESLEGQDLSYADFCVYHPIWLALSVGSASTLADYEHVRRWLGRMEALGHGMREEMSGDDAFSAAQSHDPRELPADADDHASLGQAVTIAPADYGRVGVSGTLVAATDDRLIVARDTERFGTLHVHFPREGYALS